MSFLWCKIRLFAFIFAFINSVFVASSFAYSEIRQEARCLEKVTNRNLPRLNAQHSLHQQENQDVIHSSGVFPCQIKAAAIYAKAMQAADAGELDMLAKYYVIATTAIAYYTHTQLKAVKYVGACGGTIALASGVTALVCPILAPALVPISLTSGVFSISLACAASIPNDTMMMYEQIRSLVKSVYIRTIGQEATHSLLASLDKIEYTRTEYCREQLTRELHAYGIPIFRFHGLHEFSREEWEMLCRSGSVLR